MITIASVNLCFLIIKSAVLVSKLSVVCVAVIDFGVSSIRPGIYTVHPRNHIRSAKWEYWKSLNSMNNEKWKSQRF